MLKHIKSREDWNEKSLTAKGFTLIELLVVIVILGILAAVVVFAVNGIKDKGQDSACKTEKRTLQTAIETYAAQHDSTYTTNMSDLTSSTDGYLADTPTLYKLSGDGKKAVASSSDCT